MKYHLITGILLIVSLYVSQAQTTYPMPQKTDKMLFYLQRSFNKNTIIFETEMLGNNKLNSERPVKMHWIRYEEDGRIAELSFIQRKIFGMKCTPIDDERSSFLLINSRISILKIIVKESSLGHYKAYLEINKQITELERVFIKASNNHLGIPILFEYIEVSGILTESGELNIERTIL
jgi:hypothetical protein